MQLNKKTVTEMSSSGSNLVNNAEIHNIIGIQHIISDNISEF